MNKCERCGKFFIGEPALSRKDNKTRICTHCGLAEAIEDFNEAMKKISEEDK